MGVGQRVLVRMAVAGCRGGEEVEVGRTADVLSTEMHLSAGSDGVLLNQSLLDGCSAFLEEVPAESSLNRKSMRSCARGGVGVASGAAHK